jgi:hypothetical protein
MAELIVTLPGQLAQPPFQSAVQTLKIDGKDFNGKTFSVIDCTTYDTGLGALNAPLMPVPSILFGIFGTTVKLFFAGNAKDYDPLSGEIERSGGRPVLVKGYPEGYTMKEKSEVPEIQENDLKLYLPGQDLGYESAAIVLLQIRQIGFTTQQIEQ